MDVYNNLIKNESGDDIISVNDLGYLGEGTHFFKFYTPKYPLPYVITVEGKGADDLEYSIKHLRIDTKYQNISSYRYSTRLYGLDNTKLFFTMQFIANKTFVDDVFSEKPIFKAKKPKRNLTKRTKKEPYKTKTKKEPYEKEPKKNLTKTEPKKLKITPILSSKRKSAAWCGR